MSNIIVRQGGEMAGCGADSGGRKVEPLPSYSVEFSAFSKFVMKPDGSTMQDIKSESET